MEPPVARQEPDGQLQCRWEVRRRPSRWLGGGIPKLRLAVCRWRWGQTDQHDLNDVEVAEGRGDVERRLLVAGVGCEVRAGHRRQEGRDPWQSVVQRG